MVNNSLSERVKYANNEYLIVSTKFKNKKNIWKKTIHWKNYDIIIN